MGPPAVAVAGPVLVMPRSVEAVVTTLTSVLAEAELSAGVGSVGVKTRSEERRVGQGGGGGVAVVAVRGGGVGGGVAAESMRAEAGRRDAEVTGVQAWAPLFVAVRV